MIMSQIINRLLMSGVFIIVSVIFLLLYSAPHAVAETIDEKFNMSLGGALKHSTFQVLKPRPGEGRGISISIGSGNSSVRGSAYSSQYEAYPSILFRSLYIFLSKSKKWLWNVELGYNWFEADKINDTSPYFLDVIYGSTNRSSEIQQSVDAKYMFMTPTIYYHIGPHTSEKSNAFGIGVGPGWLKAKGVLSYQDFNEDGIPFTRAHTFDFDDVGVTYNLIWNYRVDKILFQIRHTTLIVKEPDHNYLASEFELNIGYLFGI